MKSHYAVTPVRCGCALRYIQARSTCRSAGRRALKRRQSCSRVSTAWLQPYKNGPAHPYLW